MAKFSEFMELARQTVIEPLTGFRRVSETDWGAGRPLELNVLVVVLTVIIQEIYVGIASAMSGEEIETIFGGSGPMVDAAFTATLHVFVILGIWAMGYVKGLQTSLSAVAIMFGWLQLLLLGAQAVLLPVMMASPLLGGFLTLVIAVFAQPYYLVTGVMAVHGFKNPFGVAGGLILIAFCIAILMQPIMNILGIELRGLADV